MGIDRMALHCASVHLLAGGGIQAAAAHAQRAAAAVVVAPAERVRAWKGSSK